MEFKHLIIIIAIIGVAFLYFISSLNQPTFIDISQAPEFEGKKVTVEGIVVYHYTTSFNSKIIEINNENKSQLLVFIEEEFDVEYGDIIRATGTIIKYNDEWELVVESTQNIEIIQEWEEILNPLWQLAESPTKYVGMNVNTSGILDRQYESYFYLSDLESKYSIVVSLGTNTLQNVTQGDHIYVAGRFVYDNIHLRYTIEISEENHGIFIFEET